MFVTVDAPPVVNAGSTMTNTFPGTVTLPGSASDDGLPTNGTLTVNWSKISGPGTVVFGNAATTNSTATFSTSGVYVLRLAADDSIATNHSDVTVIENFPPVANAGINILTNGLQAALIGIVTDDGLPGSFLSAQWSQSAGPGTVTFGNASATNTTVTASQSGTYILVLTAGDGAATNSSELVVTFNLPPVVNAGPDQTVNFGDTVTLVGTVTDDQLPHNILTSIWTEVSGPGNAIFADASLTNTTVTFDQPGTYTLRLTASDTLAIISADVVIRINAAPVADNQTINTLEDAPVNVTLTGSDADGDMLAFQIVTAPAHGTLSGQVPNLVYTPAANYNGSDSFTFLVNDGQTDSVTATVTITVVPVNDAPQLTVPGTQTISQGVPLVFDTNRSIFITDVDAGGGQIQLALSVAHGSLSLSATNGLSFSMGTNGANEIVVSGTLSDLNIGLSNLNYAVSADYSGADTLTLTVNDQGNSGAGGPLTDTKTVAISIVAPSNVAPAVSISSPDDLSEYAAGQPIPIDVNASDADGEVANVLISADGSVLAEFTTPPFTFVWTGAPVGDHAITAMATDNTGASSTSSSVTISVLPPQSGDFQVDAGTDQVIELCQSASLAGILQIRTPMEGSETNVNWIKAGGPGDVQFFDAGSLTTTAQFSEPGTYTLRLRVSCGGGTRSDTLVVTVLPPPPQRLVAARSTKGTDFWLTYLYQPGFFFEFELFRKVIIAADIDTEVQVVSPGYWWYIWPARETNYLHIRGGTIADLSILQGINTDAEDPYSDQVIPNAIHISASAPVTVYGLCRDTYSADGFLALPTAMLSTNYMVLSYRNCPDSEDSTWVHGGTEFGVVSPRDNTHVTITPTASAGSRTAGVPFEIILQKGETYRLCNHTDANADFTGTSIASDKPVAVFGGSTLTFVPSGCWSADHLIEEMTPMSMWGQHFATMPLATRLNGDTFRFLASADGTRVSVNGNVVATLNKGQFHEQIIAGPAIILSTQSILVGQYANGTTYDNVTGDPFLMLVPPVEQFGGNYLLDALSLAGSRYYWEEPGINGPDDPGVEYTSYMNLIVYGGGTNAVSLDDELIPADQFQRIGDSDYFGAQLAVSNGNHRVSAPFPLGVCVYGWRPWESYAFTGGFYTDTVEPDTQMALTQTTPFAAVGQEKTVSAHVTDGQGLPVADIDVPFRVLGANPTGAGIDDPVWRSALLLNGANAGVDVITATLGNVTNSVTNTWVTAMANLPLVVSTTTTPLLSFFLLSGTVFYARTTIGCRGA